MVDYAQLLKLDTSKLTAAAESAAGLSTAMSARGEEVATAADVPAGMWYGSDAWAASNLMSAMPDPLYKVSDDAAHSRRVLDDLVTGLNDAKELLQDAYDRAIAGGLTVGPDGTVITPIVDSQEVARQNARLAAEVREQIDRAIVLANQADETATNALNAVGQGLKRFFGLPDDMSPSNPEMGLWIMNNLYGRAGDLADGLANGPFGKLAALAPDGTPLDPANMTNQQKFMAALKGQFTAANPDVAGLRGNLGLLSKVAGPASGVLGAIGSGVTQYNKDAAQPNMGAAERAGRATYAGAVQGATSFAGGWAGAQVGMAIGAFGGPVGIVAGAVVGGLVGGFIGSEAGGAAVNWSVDAVGDGVEAISKTPASQAGTGGHTLNRVPRW